MYSIQRGRDENVYVALLVETWPLEDFSIKDKAHRYEREERKEQFS